MSIEISAGFGQKYLFRKREDFFAAMDTELNTVKASFYKLGMYLSEAYVKRYNNGTGTDDFFEWVDNVFGLGKSTVYNLMRVYNVFHDHKDHTQLAERWNGFSQTQLTELLPAAEWLKHIDFVKPSDSCAVLRDVVKISKSMHYKPIGECADSMEYIGRFGSLLKKENSSQLEKVKPLKGTNALHAVYMYLCDKFKIVSGFDFVATARELCFEVLHL